MSAPEANKLTKKIAKKAKPGPVSLVFIYLLGVISAKWWIDHRKKRIRVYLPESKRYIARLLKLEFGGSISNVVRTNQRSVMWQATSTHSLLKIKEAANKFNRWLPPDFHQQISAFVKTHC